jgi:hypothetical protein
MVDSKKQLYDLRKAIIEEDTEKIIELTGVNEESASLLWGAMRLAMGQTRLVTSVEIVKRGFGKKWEHTPTRTIRVPVAFADDILRYAHSLDVGMSITDEIGAIKNAIRAGKRGYKETNARELIRDVMSIDTP